MLPALVDTDVLSESLKAKRPALTRGVEQYVREHGRLTFSAITLYEVERGLMAKQATRLLAQFRAIAEASNVEEVSVAILRRAAVLWADAQARGAPRNDADLIIAATALERGLALVTGNVRHFEWIEGLQLEPWE